MTLCYYRQYLYYMALVILLGYFYASHWYMLAANDNNIINKPVPVKSIKTEKNGEMLLTELNFEIRPSGLAPEIYLME